MIPKIIHYCWFGPKPMSDLEQKCIASWKTFFPDYTFMFWNEKTFDIMITPFSRQAYELKKYAFVSDYVRTKVLYEYGGIYFDTDVEVLSSFDVVLEEGRNFLGFETRAHLGTAVMAFESHHPVMKEFLAYYHDHLFVDAKGRMDNTANVTVLTDILSPLGLKNDGTKQIISSITIYPREWFYPKKLSDTEFRITEQTIAVHRCTNSWMTERQRKRGKNWFWLRVMRPTLQSFREIGLQIVGKKRIRNIEIFIRNFLK